MGLLNTKRLSELHIGLLRFFLIVSLLTVAPAPWRTRGQGGANQVTNVSAASFTATLAPGSIAAAFGPRLATNTEFASGLPLPTSLAGTTVRVNGEAAPLFYVSPGQVNYLIPPGTPAGAASIVVSAGDGTVSTGTVRIAPVAPALFTANADGEGPLASLLLRVKANGQQSFEPVAQFDETQKRFVTRPIEFGEEGDRLFLVLYLTGARQAASGSVRVVIGGVEYAPSFVGAQGGFAGLDQINLALPRNFGGRGRISLLVKAAGYDASNACDAGEISVAADVTNTPDGAGQSRQPILTLPPNAVVRFPDGSTSGRINVTPLDQGRTPAILPTGHFSSTIAQLAPFGATITPGGKLTFPNTDGLPANTQAGLFRFKQRSDDSSGDIGSFMDVGAATVSTDGRQVETTANAITETSYYFVSIQRPTAAINGRVVESDGRPVPRAIVQARGQATFTDGFGGFVLRDVPALKASGDRVRVEVSYQRPDGRVSRKEGNEVELIAGALVTVRPEIALDPVTTNFPPVILAPAALTIEAGDSSTFDFVVTDPDSAQAPEVTRSGEAMAFTVRPTADRTGYRSTTDCRPVG